MVLRSSVVLGAVDTCPTQGIVADVVIEDMVAVVPSHTGICFASFQWRKVLVL